MSETKNYAICDFCDCTMDSEQYGTMCPACLKKYEPDVQSIDDSNEMKLKKIMQESVERQKDAHGQEWLESLKARSENSFEGLPNHKENDMIGRLANENKDNFMIAHLEARRSEALQMAYYTSHKMGHFSMKIPGGDLMTEKEKFLFNVEEVKELARKNMQFIREG